MARKNRVTIPDGVYHVTARVAHGAMLLRDDEVKERIFCWIRDVAVFSGVEVYAFCIMDNHLHLLVHVPRVPKRYWLDSDEEPAAYAFGMRPEECRAPLWSAPPTPCGDSPLSPLAVSGDSPLAGRPLRPPVGFAIPDEEMTARLGFLYGTKLAKGIAEHWARMRRIGCDSAVEDEKSRYCRRMYNLSQFVKTLAERVAQRYNEAYGHKGCLWQGRFYSGVVEDVGDVLAVVAAYIDYNPVKAGIVESPSVWRWSSFGLACSGGGVDALRARGMYERMLGCSWPEARAKMEAIFADRLPDGLDEDALKALYEGYEVNAAEVFTSERVDDGADGESVAEGGARGFSSGMGQAHGRRPLLRASQVIHMGLWIFRRGGYIGRGIRFGEEVAGMLPERFPRPGMKSLRLCGNLDWDIARLAA